MNFSLDQVKSKDALKFVIGNYASEEGLTSEGIVLKGYEGKVYIN